MNRTPFWTIRGRLAAVLLLVAMSFWSLPACAAEGDTPAPDAATGKFDARDAERARLREFIPVYERAVNEGELEVLKPHLDPEFTGVMVTGEEIEGFQGLVDYRKGIQELLGEGGTYRVKAKVGGPAVFSGDMAVAHGTTEDEVVTGAGKKYSFTSQWTAVCRKTGGEWRILRVQGTMDPVKNPFVLALVGAASTTFGLIGLAVGVLVGVVICILFTRIIQGRARRTQPTS